MKFEQLFKIYLNRGFYFDGKLQKLDENIKNIFSLFFGLSWKAYTLYKKRYEITYQERNWFTQYDYFFPLFSPQIPKINIFFAKILFARNNIFELIKTNILRLYLIKTYRGRAHFLRKPVHGQRTWSNAWNAYQLNLVIRKMIFNWKQKKKKNKPKKKKSYNKFLMGKKPKKIKKAKIFKKIKIKKKINIWF